MRRTALMFVLAGLVGALVAVPIAVYASHQFTDVPNTNPFHADIDWLADAGVTKGCGTNLYCPKDNVTREQMAAFMRRLSGNDPNVAPSVNAKQLGGFSAPQLAARAAFRHEPLVDLKPSPGGGFGMGEYINVPASNGVLLMAGGIDGHIFGSDDVYSCEFTVAGQPVAGSKRLSRVDGTSSTNLEENCQTSGALAGLAAGQYLVELFVTTATGKTEFRNLSMWAVWVPVDGGGPTPP